MRIKSFWNYVGNDIVKVMKSVALVSAVFTGMMAEFVVPIIMLVWLGYKEIPFRTYMMFWIIAAVITAGSTLTFGLLTAMRYWRQTRFPYDKIVDQHGKFRVCPICRGGIEQRIFGGLMPMASDPVCQSCKRHYQFRQRLLLEDEFEIVK